MSYNVGGNRLKDQSIKRMFEQFMHDLGERNPAITNLSNLKKEISSHTATLDFKESVIASSTQNLDSETSISGSATYSGIGGTNKDGQITATLASSNTFSIDGVSFNSTDNGSRIILKDQTDQQENGIYLVIISGTSLTLDRTPDFNNDSVSGAGATTFIEQGTVNGNQKWVFSTIGPVNVGGSSGTDISFVKNSGAPTMSNIGTSGQGLFKEMQGDEMKMRNLNVGSSKLTISLDGVNDEIKFDVDETVLDVANMLNTPTGTIVGSSDSQTLTNKTFDADNNNFTNFDDTSIKSSANIDVTKIGFNYQDSSSDGQSTTALTSYQNKLSLITPTIPSGTYMVMWNAQLGNATNAAKSKVRCTIDAVSAGEIFVTGSGTGEYQSFSGFKKVPLTNAAHTIEIDHAALTGTSEISNARIMLHRVGI